ncbi:putative transcription factor PosF21 [Vitis vinifera]|uniref:Putative transcription factor PosF21 n=1 Tax=Vitis vinifera TaxID=29760 RepID=A0A438KPP7_VITVI|nr:putative transcription factor PosF21 [Vitis vinifera]
MDEEKITTQQEEDLQSIIYSSTQYFASLPLASPVIGTVSSEAGSFGNGVAFKSSNFGDQNLVLVHNTTTAGHSSLDSCRQANYQNLSSNIASVGDRPSLDSHPHAHRKNQTSSFKSLLLENTNTSHPRILSQNQQMGHQCLSPNNTGNFSQNQQASYQNLLLISSLDSNQHTFSHNQQPSPQNPLPNNTSISVRSLLDYHGNTPRQNQPVGHQNLPPNNTSINSLLDSHLQTSSQNLLPNDANAGGSSLLDSSPHSLSQNQLVDNESLLPNGNSIENGFSDWDSADGTSFLSAFEENEDLFSTFNDINHINSPESDFSMAPSLDPVQFSAEPTSVQPPVPLAPTASIPLPKPIDIVSSVRLHENLSTVDLEEHSHLDPKRARSWFVEKHFVSSISGDLSPRPVVQSPESTFSIVMLQLKQWKIIINRKAAMKAKDKRKQYLSELEYKIQSLQSKSNTFSAQLTLLQTNKDSLSAEQIKLKHRLSTIMDEVQLQEMLNEAVSEEIHNLKLLTGVLSLSPDGIELLNNGLSSQTNNHPIDAFTNPQHLPQLQVQSSSQQQRTLSNSQPMDKLRSIQELLQLQVQAPNHHQPQQLPQLQLPTSSQQQQSHREAPKQRENSVLDNSICRSNFKFPISSNNSTTRSRNN